jgi:MSHA biogenesis protein MshL
MLVFGGLILTGCSNQHFRQGDTYERINQEMQAAADNKPDRRAINEALGRAVVPPLQLDMPEAAKSEARFNLAVNNAPVAQVLTALVSGTQYSMVFAPELEGTVSLNLKNVTVREVLDTLRDVYGYDYRLQGKRIHVQSNTLQTRLFKINYLANRRQGMSEMRVTGSSPTTTGTTNSGSGQSGVANNTNTGSSTGSSTQASDSARIRTSSDFDFWKDLGTALSLIVGNESGRNVIVNANSGVVLVKAMPGELRSVDDYLKATQLVVERQVMLEAKILEVALSDSFQTGINWSKFGGVANRFALGVMTPSAAISATGTLLGSAAGLGGGTAVGAVPGFNGSMATSSSGTGFYGLAFQSSDFAALLSFLEEQGNVQVLSSPRIATTNNQKALLKVGTDDYFVTGVSSNVTTGGTTPIVSPNITLQPFFSGIALDVTPQIDDDGNIILHVHPSVSVVEEKTKTVNLGDLGIFTLPLASSSISETDSIVRVRDGSIVAIGGMMSQEQRNDRVGLPGISGLPGVGLLFGQKAGSSRKRELVILMRSTVISDDNGWRESLAESQSRLQGLDPTQRVLQRQ